MINNFNCKESKPNKKENMNFDPEAAEKYYEKQAIRKLLLPAMIALIVLFVITLVV